MGTVVKGAWLWATMTFHKYKFATWFIWDVYYIFSIISVIYILNEYVVVFEILLRPILVLRSGYVGFQYHVDLKCHLIVLTLYGYIIYLHSLSDLISCGSLCEKDPQHCQRVVLHHIVAQSNLWALTDLNQCLAYCNIPTWKKVKINWYTHSK